jgi:hypothetical protein
LARGYKGTGLGLVMVRRLTELQGGSVALHSVLGQGSTFTVWLPWRLNADCVAPVAGMTPTVCDAELNAATVGISLAAIDDERKTRDE